MDFIKIAWRDISSIMKNRFIRVSVTAIIVVPLLYSLLYLYAFWDPYTKLKDMPVAVVNMDQGGTMDDKKVNYGENIVDNLKKNDQIGWRFVSFDEAQNGVKGKGYYAMFVIPKDFSEKILSAKDGKPVQPKILYTANEKKNFLAAQINGKVSLELKTEIIKNISDEYTKVAFDSLYEVKDGMNKAADGSKQLKDGLDDAKDGGNQLKDGIAKLSDNAPQMQDGVQKLYNGAGELNTGLSAAKDGAVQLSEGIAKLKTATDSVVIKPELKALLTPETLNGAKIIMNDASVLAKADTSALGIVPQITTPQNMMAFNKIMQDFSSLDFNSITKLPQLGDMMTPQNVQNVNKLMQDAQALGSIDTSKLAPLSELLNNSDKISKLLGDAQGLSSIDVNKMAGYLNTQQEGAKKYVSAAGVLNTQDNKNALEAAVKTNPNLTLLQKTQLVTLVEGYYSLTAQTSQSMTAAAAPMGEMSNNLKALTALQQELKDNGELIAGAKQALSKENVAYLNTALTQLMGMKKDLDNNAQNIAALQGLMQQMNADADLKQSIAKLQALQSDMTAVKPIIDQVTKGLTPKQLMSIAQTPQLVNQLLGMQKDLQNNAKLLEVAQSALSDNNVKMAEQVIAAMPNLSGGINQLYAGSSKLSGGLNALYTGSTQLKDGLGTLNGNIPALIDGTTKLNDGMGTLNDGLEKLADGANELYDKIHEGADKINKNLVNDSDTMGEFVSEPIILDEKPMNAVKNYGTGFAPYFIPLSLWVGAIMMFFVITDRVDDDLNASSVSIVAGKFLSYGYIGILQAVLASVIVLVLGLKPDNVVLYFLFNIFMSFTFIAIIQSLVFLLGQVGRLLAIVLLIFQLTSCAGTFPLEIVPKMFKVLNPIMPFTYCVSGLREIISGIDYAVLGKDVAVLACMMIMFLIISMLMKGHADKVQELIKEKKQEAKAQTM